MSNRKIAAHKAQFLINIPREMLEEINRLADDEYIPKASWIKRALFQEIIRHRKQRQEPAFKLIDPPKQRRSKAAKE